MTALAITIADAFVGELNDPGRSWGGSFTAARRWLPVFKKEELATMQVSVACVGLPSDLQDRDRTLAVYDPKVAIDFQVQVESKENDVVDPVANLIDDVLHYLEMLKTPAALTNWIITGVEMDPVYDPDRLNEKRVFEALILVTLTGVR